MKKGHYNITVECGAFLTPPPPGWQLLDEGHPDLPATCDMVDVVEVPAATWRAKATQVKCPKCGRTIQHAEMAGLDVNSDEQLYNDEEAWARET